MALKFKMSKEEWLATEDGEIFVTLPHFILVTETKSKATNSTNQQKKLRAKNKEYYDSESYVGEKLARSGSEEDFSRNLQAELNEALKKIRRLEKNCKQKQKRIKKLDTLRENQKSLLDLQRVERQLLCDVLAGKDKRIELLEKNGIKMTEMMENMQTMMYQLAQLQSACPMEEPSSAPTQPCVQTMVELSILDQFVDEEIALTAELSWHSTQQQNDNGIFSVDHPVDDDSVLTAASLQPIKRQTEDEIFIVGPNLDVEIALPTEELQQLGSQQVANNLSIVCYNLNDEVDLLADDEFALRAEDSLQTCQQKLDDVIHIADDATALPSPAEELNLCSAKIEMMNVQTNAAHVSPKPTERVKKKSISSDECLDRVAFETEIPS